MPYIKESDKEKLGDIAISLGSNINNAGEFNYCLTILIQEYIVRHGLKYQTLNDIEGAISSCSKEFYRRIVAPYEDIKIKENGDVMHRLIKEKLS